MKDIVTQFLDGSVDFHIHVSPDPFVERIADANEVAAQARKLGMKGVVLKSHTYPTLPYRTPCSDDKKSCRRD